MLADSGPRPVVRLGGPGTGWRDFYEPFANDRYRQGPEYRARVPAGRYLVRVSSPDNLGKYALAIGERESFPPEEIVRTYSVLPGLKRDFFGKSPVTALSSFSGAALVVGAVAVAGAAVLVVRLARR